MPGIEFLPEQPADAGSVEVLDTGPRRRPPRWLVPLGVAVVAVAAALVLLNQDSSPPSKPAASPSPSASVPLPLNLALADGLGEPLDGTVGAAALDVAVAGQSTWVLQPQRIVGIIAPTGRIMFGSVPGRPLDDEFNDASARLVLDVPAGRLWVVVEGDARGRAVEYNNTTLARIREVDSLGLIQSAAALDGHLYVTSGNRLLDIAPGRAPVTLARVSNSLGSIVVDPARGRLLMADFGMPTRVWAIYPGAARGRQVASPVRVPMTKASLAVSSGAIWAAGYDTGSGALMRLDPRTLRPIRRSPLDPDLQPGAVAVGSGVAVIWVRPGSNDARELDCVDAAGGELLQSWQVQGPVASVGATALVATQAGAVPLDLAGCSG
jgi:outer membrane protein assembly factor BamB